MITNPTLLYTLIFLAFTTRMSMVEFGLGFGPVHEIWGIKHPLMDLTFKL